MAGRNRRARRRILRGLALVVVAVVAYQWRAPAPAPAAAPIAGALDTAFEKRQSGLWVESEGEIYRLLADDNKGSRHQQFLLRTESGLSLKFAHNIDLCERVPVKVGDRITFRGRYEWNSKGGVIHWTHHDPDGSREGGWIDFGGTRYR